MKKLAWFLSVLVTLLIVQSASALPLEVGSYGETGWQTYTHTALSDFTGRIGFLVTDTYDTVVPSQLLVDNMILNGILIEDIEDGSVHIDGKSNYGDIYTVPSYTRAIGPYTLYNPTQGTGFRIVPLRWLQSS